MPVRRPPGWTDAEIQERLGPEPPKFILDEKNGRPPNHVVVVDGQWPGIRLTRGGGGSADSGPTGAPWIDANSWRVQLARALHPRKTVWVNAALPKERRSLRAESFVLAYADVAAAGGRWIVELDGDESVWKAIAQVARFFDAHATWASFEPEAAIGVISDFKGPDEFLASEILNLTARQRQPFRVLPRAALSEASLAGLRALVYADAAAPPPALRKQLLAFVEAGGVVVAGPAWGKVAAATPHPRYAVARAGKGKLAVATRDFDDPYLIASDAQVLMSHRHDPVRLWNGGSLGSYYAASPDKRAGVLHLINYAHFRKEDPVTVWFARPWKTARWRRIDRAAAEPLPVEPVSGGAELRLPPVPVYAAIELAA
jgi:hypothetical protein